MALGNDKAIIPPTTFVTVAVTGLPNDMPANCRGILCVTDGTVSVTMTDDSTPALLPVLNGVILPGNFKSLTAVAGVTAVFAIV